MTIEVGYLLPTREGVMEGRHAAAPVVDLAAQAEAAGLDSVWIGDSVLAKPRHDPFVMLSAMSFVASFVDPSTVSLAVSFAHADSTTTAARTSRLRMAVVVTRSSLRLGLGDGRVRVRCWRAWP